MEDRKRLDTVNPETDMEQQTTPPLERIGRYQVLAKLGQGGMGAVFLAHDDKLDRKVAIKMLPPHSVDDPDAVARFRREARALAQLSHPGIIQAYDSETDDAGRHFLVMEFVAGTSLDKVLREQGKVTPPLAADYVYQAAQAMQHAHARGLIHRDLKPSNLLLTPDGRIKVLDLGLARFLQDQIRDPAQTREGTGMGTPDYAAPEQFRDAHNVDQRADIYALGCTLYHLLAGRVPFPGSSLSEKYEAHQKREPTPLQELCPEAPAGLVLTMQKMMAKKPADRFQSAAELVEALAPYVASSSPSFAKIQTSSHWNLSTLTFHALKPRQRLVPWLVAGLSLVAVAVMVVLSVSEWLPPNGAAMGSMTSNPIGGGPPSSGPSPVPQPDPDVLTVSRDAKDGGQYRKIGDALDKVKPGQTIRVLDDATYAETLNLTQASRHAGVTLEAVREATLQHTGRGLNLLEIIDVPGVVVRGFRLKGDVDQLAEPGLKVLVYVGGACPGTLLDRLRFDTNSLQSFNALEIGGQLGKSDVDDRSSSTIIRDCVFHRLEVGIYMLGVQKNYRSPALVGPVRVQNNIFEDCVKGIYVKGDVRRVQVVGNTFIGMSFFAIQLERLFSQSGDILVANNTVSQSHAAFRLWDEAIKGTSIQVRNNLILKPQTPDMVFYDSGGDPYNERGPGDGTALSRAWKFDHNWRETRIPEGESVEAKGWIPPSVDDVRREEIKDVRRDRKDPATFLRPEKDSGLATKGAGVSDPSLPSYVGALPPPGVEPWDWNRTWLAPPPGKLITVSKDPKDGGEYRTLQDALAAATPWTTIRVLDAETYDGPLELNDPEKHTGVVLESHKRAVIRLTEKFQTAVKIQNLSHVQVRGFDFSAGGQKRGSVFVVVQGHTPGVILEDLRIEATEHGNGIYLHSIENEPNEPPAIVRHCRIKVPILGIQVFGPLTPEEAKPACRGILIQKNQISGSFTSLYLQGNLADIQVTGNTVWESKYVALEIEDLPSWGHSILMANNTACKNAEGFRVFCSKQDAEFGRGQVEFCGNILVDNSGGDATVLVADKDGTFGIAKPKFGQTLRDMWRFEGNWRDQGGLESSALLPLSPFDHKAGRLKFLSAEPNNADFMKPPKDSPLATGGLGAKGPWLPEYAGAVPPKGVAPWDWSLTWRARHGGLPSKP